MAMFADMAAGHRHRPAPWEFPAQSGRNAGIPALARSLRITSCERPADAVQRRADRRKADMKTHHRGQRKWTWAVLVRVENPAVLIDPLGEVRQDQYRVMRLRLAQEPGVLVVL
jgi:hypothetical protein